MSINKRKEVGALLDKYFVKCKIVYDPADGFKPETNRPTIIYTKANADIKFANNVPYISRETYNILYVTSDPTDDPVDVICNLFEDSRLSVKNANISHFVVGKFYQTQFYITL